MSRVPSPEHGLPWTEQAGKAVSLGGHRSAGSPTAAATPTWRTGSPCRAQQLNGSNIPDKSWKFLFLQLLIPTTCNEEPGKEWFENPVSECICRLNHTGSVIQILTQMNQSLEHEALTLQWHFLQVRAGTGRTTPNQGLSSLIVIFKVCVCILKSEIA